MMPFMWRLRLGSQCALSKRDGNRALDLQATFVNIKKEPILVIKDWNLECMWSVYTFEF